MFQLDIKTNRTIRVGSIGGNGRLLYWSSMHYKLLILIDGKSTSLIKSIDLRKMNGNEET